MNTSGCLRGDLWRVRVLTSVQELRLVAGCGLSSHSGLRYVAQPAARGETRTPRARDIVVVPITTPEATAPAKAQSLPR